MTRNGSPKIKTEEGLPEKPPANVVACERDHHQFRVAALVRALRWYFWGPQDEDGGVKKRDLRFPNRQICQDGKLAESRLARLLLLASSCATMGDRRRPVRCNDKGFPTSRLAGWPAWPVGNLAGCSPGLLQCCTTGPQGMAKRVRAQAWRIPTGTSIDCPSIGIVPLLPHAIGRVAGHRGCCMSQLPAALICEPLNGSDRLVLDCFSPLLGRVGNHM